MSNAGPRPIQLVGSLCSKTIQDVVTRLCVVMTDVVVLVDDMGGAYKSCAHSGTQLEILFLL